ncbi:3-isopropylmalate dehydratase large subunit [Candidatus Carsonella ruddii HT isolate Thao2000]|uniref:3-isopropylmalate dehydratase n=1 Tax=Candidatus Carsonella ruddii HT isolate Thao2000 TaxID=1202539 RepID=J3VQA7_CARRU|nr:aconitase family protein [Candidatus Carsonella ruddii]AFP84126.1 3-isopropylmalate dehydratase large subunit [Candidatus Carsonella ruddii HT isolate Thao2000]
MNNTLYDNIIKNHVINIYDSLYLLYVDKILLHEVTSPQSFKLISNNFIWNNKSILSTSDHNVSTNIKKRFFLNKKIKQLKYINKNKEKYFFKYFDLNNPKQGIIHIIAIENSFLLPGMIIVCGDSHTTTNGAISLIANGIGTTDLSIAISTQCIIQKKLKNFNILLIGKNKLFSKDLILFIIKKISSKGGINYCIEFSGEQIENYSISERMTICNMSIEAGSKISLISPDIKTINFYKKKIFNIKKFLKYINKIKSNKNSYYQKKCIFNIDNIIPHVTWGTNLDTIINIDEKINSNDNNMLEYMGLKNNEYLINKKIDKMFFGSCTNSRLEDLLICAILLLKINKKIFNNIIGYIVPGTETIRLKLEFYKIHKIYIFYGYIWKNSGCSMCLAMNEDKLLPKERCVSTSNRNFISRQGYKGRTHLVSPVMAIIVSIYGKFISYKTYCNIINEINF